jgi:hypothetical protein
MTRFGFNSLWAGMLFFAATRAVSFADTKADAPDFQEVYQLIRTHLPGISEAELNRAAVQGLVSALAPKVTLGTNQISNGASEESPLISKSSILENHIGYLRVGRVGDGLAKEMRDAFQKFNSTNKLTGLVLDLRYASGSDYSAAAATADLFTEKAQPLLNVGSGVISSKDKSDAIQVPLAILVNSGTSGAAEALAGVLRSTGAGLVLGSKTAGTAMISQDYPLKSGGTLRIASAPVTLGNGTALTSDGIKPDIDIMVRPEEERSYYADAFYVEHRTNSVASANGSSTNQANATNASRRVRFNEAELVREHRAGLDRNGIEPATRTRDQEADSPLVSDPALARAIDLLKGLAVVRQSRS